ncbi:hypothetical protein [Mucilaginibacter panaciglaebae]|uniref:DUF4369 domain-containing protein n=1 Tax=Mucilaginibacter panaciglaebae TaxID=502331 RepID=A0ABP7WW83_9SPHI
MMIVNKKNYVFLFLICSNINVWAQFKLSGTIKHYSGRADLKINIPQVYGFDEANSIKIAVAKNGSFSITLPIKSQKFADVIFQQNFHLILLTKGKSLHVELIENNKSFKPSAGTGLAVNTVLQAANIEEYPFFLQNDGAYTSLSPVELNNKLVRPYLAMRDKKIAIVNRSSINPRDKKLIAAELKYAAYNNLYELYLLGGQYHEKLTNLVITAFDKADPKPEAFPPGPQYYMFANYYLWYRQAKSSTKVKAKNIKPTQLMPDYGLTVAQFNAYKAKYGEPYLRWLSATRFLPRAVAEQLGYLLISTAVNNGNKELANKLVKDYMQKFPAGLYKADINRQIAG